MYKIDKIFYLLITFAVFSLPFVSYGSVTQFHQSVESSVEFPVSAARNPEQPWEEALSRAMPTPKLSDINAPASIVTLNALRTEMSLDVKGLPEWTQGIEALNSLTTQAWMARRYSNPNRGDFLRRAPWLFPVDGCYAKAAHVSAEAARRGYKKPGKVFAYGDLEYQTRYARNGRKTYWSYHVAAGYRIGEQIYVLDPMINSQGVLSLSAWLAKISPKPSSVKVKLCDANAYSPSSRCRGSRGGGAYTGHMRGILLKEWSHLLNIGYDPAALLGPSAAPLP